MLSSIRKNQYSLTLFIVILTIISFIWLYNRTNLSQVGTNDVAIVNGRVIQQAEIERWAREYQLAMALGLTDFVRDLGGFAENEEMGFSEFIFNALVIQHEAPLLNVVPSEESIAGVIRSLPPFQTEGSFDAAKYASFMQEQLAPRGFTERHLEEIIRDLLCFQKLHQIIVSPISVSEAQVREAARVYQPVTAQLLRFDRGAYLKEAKKSSTEEEKAFYEKNKTAFVTEEVRAVSYVLFQLPAEQQKLQGKERVRGLQKLADVVTTLRKKSEEGIAAGKSFATVAKAGGSSVVTTGVFNRRGENSEGLLSKSAKTQATTAPNDKKIPAAVVAASFKLSKEGDLSEVVQEGSSFYIIALEKKVPSRPLAFSEVELKIDAILREQKAEKLMKEAAQKTMSALHEAMAGGKSFSEAVALTHQKVESLAGVSLRDKTKLLPDQQVVLNATLTLNEKELSDLKHAPWGEFIVYLQSRAPLSAADWEAHHGMIEQEFLEQEQNMIFSEWLTKARADAKITMLNRHSRRR